MEKNSNSIKDANESDNFFFQLLGFIHLCHDNVKAAAAAVPNSLSKSESSNSFELDIEGQAVRMSWCRRAAHADGRQIWEQKLSGTQCENSYFHYTLRKLF